MSAVSPLRLEAIAQTPEARMARTGRAIVICDQWLGSDGYAGMKALRRAGWNVLVEPEWEFVPVRWRSQPMRVVGRVLRGAAVREFNSDLVRLVRRFGPALLLVFKGRFVHPRAIRQVRAMGVTTYCFYPDVSFRAHGPLIPRALPEYDWIFTTKSFGLADMRDQLGVTRASLIQFAYDPDLHRPIELAAADRSRFECDVSYIGTWSLKKERLLAELIRRRPAIGLKIWGEQWWRATTAQIRDHVVGHEVIGDDYVRAVCGSAINLSIMSEAREGASMGDQVASRTFSVPACGGFAIHERTDEVRRLFREDEEIVCYSGIDELVERVDQFLSSPERRRQIAERARQVVVRAHSWDVRIREILAHRVPPCTT